MKVKLLLAMFMGALLFGQNVPDELTVKVTNRIVQLVVRVNNADYSIRGIILGPGSILAPLVSPSEKVMEPSGMILVKPDSRYPLLSLLYDRKRTIGKGLQSFPIAPAQISMGQALNLMGRFGWEKGEVAGVTNNIVQVTSQRPRTLAGAPVYNNEGAFVGMALGQDSILASAILSTGAAVSPAGITNSLILRPRVNMIPVSIIRDFLEVSKDVEGKTEFPLTKQ